jgi:ubiquinone/menaquinone biosynthesis C-methylase UbiE
MKTDTKHTCAVSLHDSLAHRWEEKYSRPGFKRRSNSFLAYVDLLPIEGQLWLDGGCGTGFPSRPLLERGCRIVGVDASQGMLGIAQTQINSQPCEGRLFCRIATIEKLPLRDNAFDGVICSSVIEYLHDPKACLEELHRVLKPGGVLLISVPNSQSALRRFLKFTHSMSGSLFNQPWPHYLKYSRNEYTVDEFKNCLKEVGMDIMHYKYFSPIEVGEFAKMWTGSLIIFMVQKPL